MGYTLVRGSLALDIAPDSTASYLSLPTDERAVFEDHFTDALHGGDDELLEELFDALSDAEFRATLEVDEDGQIDPAELVATANQVLTAYNKRADEFDLTFASIDAGTAPSGMRFVWNGEAQDWDVVYSWALTLSTGNAKGSNFNWLPLSAAQNEGDYKLPEELDFMVSGKQIKVDARYQLTLTFEVQ